MTCTLPNQKIDSNIVLLELCWMVSNAKASASALDSAKRSTCTSDASICDLQSFNCNKKRTVNSDSFGRCALDLPQKDLPILHCDQVCSTKYNAPVNIKETSSDE